jgi:hypothetical protein
MDMFARFADRLNYVIKRQESQLIAFGNRGKRWNDCQAVGARYRTEHTRALIGQQSQTPLSGGFLQADTQVSLPFTGFGQSEPGQLQTLGQTALSGAHHRQQGRAHQ